MALVLRRAGVLACQVRTTNRSLNRFCTAARSASSSSSPGKSSGDDELSAAELRQLLVAAAAERADMNARLTQLSADVGMLGQALREESGRNLLETRMIETGEEPGDVSQFRPRPEDVLAQPTHISQMDNQTLIELSIQGNHGAQKERLLREIMTVDSVTWEAAHTKLGKMDEHNERFYWMETLPYRIGITGAFVLGFGSIPMVFSHSIARAYGTTVAGADLPEGVADIAEMTVNQVGEWTWGWMEPMIGTGSFVLLCSQFMRAQAWKLNMSPYSEAMLRGRANRLANAYPEYNRTMVRQWAKHLPMVGMGAPIYRRSLGFKGPTS